MDLFNDIAPLLKAFWFVAIPSSLIFIIQTIMTFLGMDAADGLEADFDSNLDGIDAPFQLFSLRNLINFLLGFSWTGIALFNTISNHTLLIAIAVIVGVGFVYLFFIIIKQIIKLAEDNSFHITSTLNKTAEVYLPIPAEKKGKGKVLISINGAIHELDAMTENTRIESGTTVLVDRIELNQILIVKPLTL